MFNDLKLFKNNITIFIISLLILTGIVAYLLNFSLIKSFHKERINKLQSVHNEAVAKVNYSLNNFATLISALKSFVENKETLPTDIEVQTFILDILDEIYYQDSIVISYVDTNHYFVYSFTRSQIDPANLVGKRVTDIRDTDHIARLNKAMADSSLYLSEPINLIEG